MRDDGGERVEKWGWGSTSPPNAFSVCLCNVRNGRRLQDKQLVDPAHAAESYCESAPGSGPGVRDISQPVRREQASNSPGNFHMFSPLFEEEKLRATEET